MPPVPVAVVFVLVRVVVRVLRSVIMGMFVFVPGGFGAVMRILRMRMCVIGSIVVFVLVLMLFVGHDCS